SQTATETAKAPGAGDAGRAATWRDRAGAADWDRIRADQDAYGCGLIGPLLNPGEAAEIVALYSDDSRFRSTINMARHRFGEGEYRYFTEPFPEAVAGQRRPTPILLKYGEGDWNALHRDLYGELVFPLQVVVNLSNPGVDHTGGEFLLYEQRSRDQSPATATLIPHGHGLVFTTRDRPVQ